MQTIVCIKSVAMQAGGGRPLRDSGHCAFNPFDQAALEMALTFRERHGGQVTVLSMGPMSSRLSLLEAMAAGADRGILVSDPALRGSDTLITARVLSAAIRRLTPFDLVFFGTRTADSDTGQVGPQTATLLQLPLVTWARTLEYVDEGLQIERTADGYRERYASRLPAAVTIHPGAGVLRDADLADIQSVLATDPVEEWTLSDLSLSAGEVGEQASPTRVVATTRTRKNKACHFIEGAADEQADALIDRLVADGLLE
jgi:electron transfer flavoprotein beta subunit